MIAPQLLYFSFSLKRKNSGEMRGAENVCFPDKETSMSFEDICILKLIYKISALVFRCDLKVAAVHL